MEKEKFIEFDIYMEKNHIGQATVNNADLDEFKEWVAKEDGATKLINKKTGEVINLDEKR